MENKYKVMKSKYSTLIVGEVVEKVLCSDDGHGAWFTNGERPQYMTTVGDNAFGKEVYSRDELLELFPIGSKVKINDEPCYAGVLHFYDVGDEVIILELGDNLNYRCEHVSGRNQWVSPHQLDLIEVAPQSTADNLLQRLYDESIANGYTKNNGKIVPIIPGALMKELQKYVHYHG